MKYIIICGFLVLFSCAKPQKLTHEIIKKNKIPEILTLKGYAKISVTSQKEKITTNGFIFIKDPNFLKIELDDFFNNLIYLLIINKDEFLSCYTKEKTIFTGKITEKNIEEILYTKLTLNQFFDIILNRFNFSSNQKLSYEILYSEYKEIRGNLFPFKLIIKDFILGNVIEIKYKDIIINEPIDEKFFNFPELKNYEKIIK
jgi:outer membrane lipoprotein-sorting protein